MKRMLLVLCVLTSLITSQNISAQEGNESLFDDSLKDIAIVGGLGAGGAILGLSTLSFTEEPSEHLKNIVVGAAIGIIIGVGVVAYSQAAKSQDLLQVDSNKLKDFGTKDRIKWHAAQNSRELNNFNSMQPKFNYTFSF